MELPQFDSLIKIAGHREWLSAYLSGKTVAPICIEMDLTNECNYECPNCAWAAYIGRNRSQICREQALKQVRQCIEADIKAIIFSGGGEPLLNPIALDIIAFARSSGLQV